MNPTLKPISGEVREAISKLFMDKPPVLAEIRFPSAGTSPDWFLLEDEDEFDEVLDKLGTGPELHLNSVWDLRSTKDEVCVRI